MNHLSSMDASFLHLETPETPMHVGSLMLFDLPDDYRGDYCEDVKAQLAKGLHLARIFHRKLATMPFELADPVWIEDDDIDLDLQRIDHQPAFVRQPVGALGGAEDARQADGRHVQRRGDGDVQRRAAQLPA